MLHTVNFNYNLYILIWASIVKLLTFCNMLNTVNFNYNLYILTCLSVVKLFLSLQVLVIQIFVV